MPSLQDNTTIEAVESLIQYKFKKPVLLWEALHVNGSKTDGNKRLAVIGDSVLSLALAEDWYNGATNRGDWSDNFQKGVGSNKNLNRCGLALGLERFIYGGNKGKKVADTIEAILGAIYLDSGSSMAKCKDVMDALELFPQKQRLEREYDIEGLIFLDDHSLQPLLAKKGPSSVFKEMGPVVLEDPGIQPLQPKERPNPTF